MAEYAGVLSIAALVLLFVAALFALGWRLSGQSAAHAVSDFTAAALGKAAGEAAAGREPPALDRFALAHDLYPLALFYAVGGVGTALLLAGAPALRALGWPGLRALAVFALPLCVGFLYEWHKGVFKW